jgi:hypothetical protein
MRLKLSRIGSGVLTVAFMCAAAAATHPAASRFDPARARPGRFTYRLLEDGKPTGSATITIRSNADGTFAFANVVSGSFAQRWSATTDASFAPISVELTFQQDAVPTMQLHYANGHVVGRTVARGPDPKVRAVDEPVPSGIVDQRLDWAALLSSELHVGQEFSFNVYDPVSGVSRVHGRVADLEQAHVVAGVIAAFRLVYRMEKRSNSERYELLISRDEPRIMVLERFPDGAVSELVEVEAISP